MDIEQHGARRIGGVGGMHPAAGEAEQEEAVHRAEGQFALLRPRAGARHLFEDVGDLGGGEIGIDEQAGASADQRAMAFRLKAGAGVGRAPVLPDYGAVDGAAGGALPHQRRLALVGDADGGDVGWHSPCLPQHRAAAGKHRVPDVLRFLLHLAGGREMLG